MNTDQSEFLSNKTKGPIAPIADQGNLVAKGSSKVIPGDGKPISGSKLFNNPTHL